MVNKVLNITCIVLMLVLAVLTCFNAWRTLTAGYEKMEFTITNIYTDHVAEKAHLTVQTTENDKLVQPENRVVSNRLSYKVGDTMSLWYDKDTNLIVQNYIPNILFSLFGTLACVACTILIWPRKTKTVKAVQK